MLQIVAAELRSVDVGVSFGDPIILPEYMEEGDGAYLCGKPPAISKAQSIQEEC